MNIFRHIVLLFIFLSVNANAALSAETVYINSRRVDDYIETLSQGHKSGGDKNADILKRMESIDGFIQGNIILWETFTVDERKRRIKDFEAMLKGFYRDYKTAKESSDAERISMRNEFTDRVSLIIKDIMTRNKTHVILEINKKEDMLSGAVDITDNVIEELTRYAKNKRAEGAQEITDADSILYRLGYNFI
ncbi:MAG: hypothetical protein HZB79_04540 [Deltaproteobacteria bacterium]|nr:hypothetical protein [Deltaproteobacteria bacterium]